MKSSKWETRSKILSIPFCIAASASIVRSRNSATDFSNANPLDLRVGSGLGDVYMEEAACKPLVQAFGCKSSALEFTTPCACVCVKRGQARERNCLCVLCLRLTYLSKLFVYSLSPSHLPFSKCIQVISSAIGRDFNSADCIIEITDSSHKCDELIERFCDLRNTRYMFILS